MRRTKSSPGRTSRGPKRSSSSLSKKPFRKGKGTDERPEHSRKKKSSEPKIRKKHRGPWAETAYKTSAPLVRPVGSAPVEKSTERALPGTGDGKERLQKVLARAGVASRRNAEVLILEGAVTVNGRIVTELGTKVDAKSDKIKVNGKLIYTEVEPIYLALYKPKGVISSLADPEGRQHLGGLLHAIRERVVPIGRLNYNSEGLILLTNDGNLAEEIIKARQLPRVYMVKIKGHPTERDLEFLKRGIFTAEGVVQIASFGVEQSLKSKSWLKLEVTSGSQLDLRELLNQRGLLVDRIVRTAIGHITVQGIEPGEYKFMKRGDFERLLTTKVDR